MTKHKFPILMIVLTLVVVSFLAGYQIGGQQNEAVASAHESNVNNQAVGNGLSYARGSLTGLSANDVSAYRWQAIARFYAKDPYIGVDLTTLSPDDVMAFRWQAMARTYQAQGLAQTK
jgi:hypothetical protein